MAHIEVGTKPLARNYDEGEEVIMIENGKKFRMRLIENAFAGETRIKVIPLDEVLH